jgi:hypothetical protein
MREGYTCKREKVAKLVVRAVLPVVLKNEMAWDEGPWLIYSMEPQS